MRREFKENLTRTFILRPYESRAIRCKSALNKELKYNKSRHNTLIAVRELFDNTYTSQYVYKFTPRLNELSFDIARTDETGRLKEYIPAGSKDRIKLHLLKLMILRKKRSHFTLCINNLVFPLVSLKDIRFGDKIMRICRDGEYGGTWLYYGDITRLEVL